MTTTGLYEASGLALWLKTGALDAPKLPADDVNWGNLLQFEEQFFSRAVCFKAHVSRGANAGKKQKVTRSRLLWPCTMVSAVDSLRSAAQSNFEASLPLAGGCFILWAWYLAMFKALRAQDRVECARECL